MCDAATTEMIRDEVLERVSRKEPFTAWDITVEARKKGAKARHGEMKKVVHALFHEDGVMPGFLRTAVMIPGVAVPPWLYHPAGYDVKEYVKSLTPGNASLAYPGGNGSGSSASPGGNGSGVHVSTAAVSAAKPKTIAKNADGSYDRQVGEEGYLYVPTFLVSGAGWSSGDPVHVYESSGKLVVSSKEKRDGDEPAGSCLVDSKGKIRLHKRFLGQNVNHKMTLKDNEVLVEPIP